LASFEAYLPLRYAKRHHSFFLDELGTVMPEPQLFGRYVKAVMLLAAPLSTKRIPQFATREQLAIWHMTVGDWGCANEAHGKVLRPTLNHCKFTASKGIALALLLYVHQSDNHVSGSLTSFWCSLL
jgi:hypothetical protein